MWTEFIFCEFKTTQKSQFHYVYIEAEESVAKNVFQSKLGPYDAWNIFTFNSLSQATEYEMHLYGYRLPDQFFSRPDVLVIEKREIFDMNFKTTEPIMDKPKPEFSFVVTNVYPKDQEIHFSCSNADDARELNYFGIVQISNSIPQSFILIVSPLFNFGQVVEYVNSLSSKKE